MGSESDSPSLSESPPPPSSDGDSSDDSSSSSSSSPNSSPPPPPPQSDDQSSPPPSPPPPQSDKGSDSSPSRPPPPDNGWNNKSQSPPSPPPPHAKSSPSSFSPPPPNNRLSPSGRNSPSGSSNSTPDSSSSGDSGGTQLSIPTIVGVAAGAGLLFLVIILVVIACSRRRKRSGADIYYFDHAGHDDDYFKRKTSTNQPWNKGDHVLNMPPPPGAGAKSWGAPAPPQVVSSDMSNASYSGPQGPALPPPHPSVALGFNKSNFTYEELSAATGGFAQANLLGQGGFGYVHKGVLPNGKEIAVKSLKSTGGQGDREFQAEVDIISRVHHRHLVSLVGYCISNSNGKSLLVYEFVPNKTLEYHLHGKGRPVMDWGTRLKIAIGSAKGLAYLHEDCHPRIIHRDIKGANILIEDNFEAKVADFGLAKLNQDTNTHVSTRVMGTFGYLAPEYASSGKLTEKSDVFSYGIMLLELITGRPPVDTAGDYEEDSLAEWARPLCARAMETGNYEGLVDPRLENNYDKQEMARMVACAASSIRHSARKRPKMSQIVRALEGDVSLDDLSEGVKPGQSAVFNNASGEYDASTYSADMKRFRKLALESGCGSSEYGATSEYGLNPSSTSSDSADYGRSRMTVLENPPACETRNN